MELRERLQQLRKQNGLSQEELADKIGIARQTISKMGDENSQITDFLILAKRNTYAAKKNQVESSRTASCDYYYKDDSGYEYYDTYLGGAQFIGEEVIVITVKLTERFTGFRDTKIFFITMKKYTNAISMGEMSAHKRAASSLF